MATTATPATAHGGRGARERILAAAGELFYRQGLNATGVEQLAETAHVSKRTLYQHFPSKDDVMVAYLERITPDMLSRSLAQLQDTSVPARDRLVRLFRPDRGSRGCPYLNATAELCDDDHPARLVARARKQEFVDRLTALAAEAGASDAAALGSQLAVLSDGARAQAAALGSDVPFTHAQTVAELLIDRAVSAR